MQRPEGKKQRWRRTPRTESGAGACAGAFFLDDRSCSGEAGCCRRDLFCQPRSALRRRRSGPGHDTARISVPTDGDQSIDSEPTRQPIWDDIGGCTGYGGRCGPRDEVSESTRPSQTSSDIQLLAWGIAYLRGCAQHAEHVRARTVILAGIERIDPPAFIPRLCLHTQHHPDPAEAEYEVGKPGSDKRGEAVNPTELVE